jgi:hypothetical protein
MILQDLKAYLVERRRASIADLTARFDTDAEALRGMLAHWLGKGRLRRVDVDGACGGCCGCATSAAEVYEWVDAGAGR